MNDTYEQQNAHIRLCLRFAGHVVVQTILLDSLLTDYQLFSTVNRTSVVLAASNTSSH